ncbi:MAG: DUF4129 domain-containing protein [Thermoplasmata archaeon]
MNADTGTAGAAPPKVRTPARFSPAIALFVLSAVAFGAAASLLAAPVIPPPPQVVTGATGTPGSTVVLGIELVGFVLIGVAGWRIAVRLKDRVAYPNFAIAAVLLVFIATIAIAILLREFGHGFAGVGGSAPPPAANGTGSSSGGSGTNGTGNGFGVPLESGGVPGWVEYLAILVGGLVVATVVTPFLIAAHRDREARGTGRGATPSARATIGLALEGLDADPDADPRSRIVAAYARLLSRIEDGPFDLASLTPREIERECTVHLGVTPATSHELTLLFEEARYSPHPIPIASVERARASLTRALSDLDRHPRKAT